VKNLFEKSNNKFIIIGVSFGCLLALELTNKLEGDNMDGRLIMLDGGPDYLKHPYAFSQVRHMEDFAIQSTLALVEQVYPGSNINYKLLFEGLSTVEQKIDAILNYFENSTDYQFQSCGNLQKIFNGVANREKFYREYDGSHMQTLESKILLIRSEDSKNITYVDKTYGLDKYARQDVDVKFVKGNHITMFDDPELVQVLKEASEAI
jgi:fatty acid synthase